jgi:sugar phosphate isomerase/epimerase
MHHTKGIERIDRRGFLGMMAAAGVGLGLGGCASAEGVAAGTAAGVAAGGRRLERIGVQLYTVRDRLRADLADTVRQVAAIGYREVETHDLFGLSPAEFRALLDRNGLVTPAGHVGIAALRGEVEGVLAAAHVLGQRWVVVPWLPEEERTAPGYRRVAADLNRAGEVARGQGMRVAYHNHEWEFDRVEGERTGYDILLSETDPALVDLELDLFWAMQAGQDPVALFERQPGRFPLCHVKDMAGIGGEQRMVEVGEGEIDFARIFAHAELAGLRHFFVEHDNPRNSIESIRTSHANLSRLTF